jgi:hypothetical protein
MTHHRRQFHDTHGNPLILSVIHMNEIYALDVDLP